MTAQGAASPSGSASPHCWGRCSWKSSTFGGVCARPLTSTCNPEKAAVPIRQSLPLSSSQAQDKLEAFCETGGRLPRHPQQHAFLSARALRPPALARPTPTTPLCQPFLPPEPRSPLFRPLD